jgi:hypothetical protein
MQIANCKLQNDASDEELFEAVWQFRRNIEAAATPSGN